MVVPALSSLPFPSPGGEDEEDEEVGRVAVAGLGVVPWGRLPLRDRLL